MSTGKRIPLAIAEQLAERIASELTPHVQRLQVVGSIRRRRPMVGDIEMVAEPLELRDMFGSPSGIYDVGRIREVLNKRVGRVARGGLRLMKVVDVYRMIGVSLDLFLVHPPAQWGSIVAIRTGPKNFSQWCVTRMRRRGYRHRDGHAVIEDTGELIPTPTEEDFFRIAGVGYLEPWERDR